MWVHLLNQKRTENNSIKRFVCELRKDELKFKNVMPVSSETFDYILIIIFYLFINISYMYTFINVDTRYTFIITCRYRYIKIYKTAVYTSISY